MKPEIIFYEQQNGVNTITLNRPERLNAITFEVYHELTDFIAKLRDEKDLRVVGSRGPDAPSVRRRRPRHHRRFAGSRR
jgi:enoyl-CoA hydratase/carnithine racemase